VKLRTADVVAICLIVGAVLIGARVMRAEHARARRMAFFAWRSRNSPEVTERRAAEAFARRIRAEFAVNPNLESLAVKYNDGIRWVVRAEVLAEKPREE
jgi:hypothetical protein